jgi:hypothetical protein
MKRVIWLLAICLLASAALVGCAPADEGKTAPPSKEEDGVKSTTEAEDAELYPALKPETDGEREALEIAQTEAGRKWASGDFQNGTPVPGDARLVGYSFRLNDGATQYQVRVMNGTVYGYVGGTSDKALAGQYEAGWYNDPAPETDRQREAWDTALAEVAKVNPNATSGGIESYIIMFPALADGSFPEVLVFADAKFRAEYSSNFAMGGTWFK